MPRLRRHLTTLLFTLLAAALIGCSDGSDDFTSVIPPEFLAVPNPTVSMPPDEGSINLLAQNFDLGSVGYQQSEYFLEGTAKAFTNTSELGMDGVWSVEPGEEANYRTRIIVYRPINPADFNGNVVMMAAGYNAGPRRPISWMERYGDPRTGEVDIVDWIETIPFSETRNYVMRVTESLPVYRARLGKPPLPIPVSAELTGSTLRAFAP